MVCDDEAANPRASPHLNNNCRRKSDVDADKRAMQDQINYGQRSQQSR